MEINLLNSDAAFIPYLVVLFNFQRKSYKKYDKYIRVPGKTSQAPNFI